MDISYLHGRAVVDVLTGVDASGYDEAAQWAVKLEGEGYIFCFDASHEAPTLTGLAFTTSTVTQTEARLYFGTDQNPTGTMIVLRPEDYGYMDDLYSEGVVERPQTGPQEATGATDTPAEPDPRAAEGPSQEWLDAQEERRLAAEDDDGA